MTKTLLETYTDELKFLISLKQSVGILNNRIHDKLAWIAVEKLRTLHPGIDFRYAGAGAGGIDIRGFGPDGSLRVVAEVKTTHTSEAIPLRGPQKQAIERDLQRLADEPGAAVRYLVVISEQTKRAIDRQIKPQERFPGVTILDAVGMEFLPSSAAEEEEL